MSAADSIARALGARTSTGMRGTGLTFQRGDHWHTLTVRESPRLELSLPAPGLVGLELKVQLGTATVRGGDTRVDDPRWRVRSNDLQRALELFDEAPWPEGEAFVRPPGSRLTGRHAWLLGLIVAAPGIGVTVAAYLADREERRYLSGSRPYSITVEDQVAVIEQHGSDPDHALAIGMAERLVQLVTRPARREAEIAHASPRDSKTNGPYR